MRQASFLFAWLIYAHRKHQFAWDRDKRLCKSGKTGGGREATSVGNKKYTEINTHRRWREETCWDTQVEMSSKMGLYAGFT